MNSLIVTLPWPATELWSNRNHGRHWATMSITAAQARDEARILTHVALDGLSPAITSARLVFTFHAPSRRRYDLANCLQACKNSIDGIADCLGIDDSMFNPIELRRGNVIGGGCVEVAVFWPGEPAAAEVSLE